MKDFFRDLIDQTWTLLGMFIAWLVLEGSARTIVGYAIIWSLVVWVITYRLRNPKEEDEE
jgi:hypothetical protein